MLALQPFQYSPVSSSVLLSCSLLKIPSGSAKVFIVDVLSFKCFHEFLQETPSPSLLSSLLPRGFDNPRKKVSLTACNTAGVHLGTFSLASTSSKSRSTAICAAPTSSATASYISNIAVVVVVIGWVIAVVVVGVVILIIWCKHRRYSLNWPPHHIWSDHIWPDHIWSDHIWPDYIWPKHSGS